MSATNSKLDALLAFTLPEEGGYSVDPHDPGGATNLGVTLETLSDYNAEMGLPKPTVADVKALTVAKVTPIYASHFYNPMCCQELPLGVDLMVFDYGVNAGPFHASRTLQQVLGFEGDDVDGSIGPQTLAAVAAVKDVAGLIAKLHDARATYYRTLSDFVDFGPDWEGRTNRCQVAALTMAGIKPSAVITKLPLGTLLVEGSNGIAVALLQDALQSGGFYAGSLNGNYDTATRAAVAAYQGKHGLHVDGEAGEETLESLGLV